MAAEKETMAEEGARVNGREMASSRRPNGPAERGTPSPLAVPEVTRALRRFSEEKRELFRKRDPGELPYDLERFGYLDHVAHYLEVVEAIGNLGIVFGVGTPESVIARDAADLRREYLHGEYTGTLHTKNPDGTWEPKGAYGPYPLK